MITLYTIGFTKKSAEQFFESLRKNEVKKLVDIRINNTGQLAGFAKGRDLAYFLKEIVHIGYEHIADFAPTKELLADYQKQQITWEEYEEVYTKLLKSRKIMQHYGIHSFDGACFLCSEETPEHCHRRLLVEYLKAHSTEEVKIIHLI